MSHSEKSQMMESLSSREHRSREGGSRFDIGASSSQPQASAAQVERTASNIDASASAQSTTQADQVANPELTQKPASLLD